MNEQEKPIRVTPWIFSCLKESNWGEQLRRDHLKFPFGLQQLWQLWRICVITVSVTRGRQICQTAGPTRRAHFEQNPFGEIFWSQTKFDAGVSRLCWIETARWKAVCCLSGLVGASLVSQAARNHEFFSWIRPGWGSLSPKEPSSAVRASCMGWEFLSIMDDSLAIIFLSHTTSTVSKGASHARSACQVSSSLLLPLQRRGLMSKSQ